QPTSASAVLPAAIAQATPTETPLVAFEMSAPTAMAGQSCGPRRSSAAIAIPAGGQTGVITPWATDSLRPNLAAPTYRPATTAHSSPRRARARVRTPTAPLAR